MEIIAQERYHQEVHSPRIKAAKDIFKRNVFLKETKAIKICYVNRYNLAYFKGVSAAYIKG